MKKSGSNIIIGVISDTHGLLRPEAEKLLKGSNIIIHAGDIGNPEIVNALNEVALVKAIRGNIDKGKWADNFPETLDLKIFNKKIFVIHNVKDLNFNPPNERYDIVVSGHSHKPLMKEVGSTLYFNPGSAGQKRFNLPVTIGQIKISKDKISGSIFEINS